MKKALALLLLLSGPALADEDNLPQFPKIAPPDPLPETACQGVAQPVNWGLGDWVSPTLRVHVEKTAWSISGSASSSGTQVVLEDCRFSLNTESDPVFAGVRAEDGRMYGAYWTAKGKVQRLELVKQTGN